MVVIQLVLAKGGIVQIGWKFAEPEGNLFYFLFYQVSARLRAKKNSRF